jgi:hypothetical protein
MRISTGRLWLLLLFVVSFIVHFAIFAITYFAADIYAEDFEALTLNILTIYSIPLGVILGGFFAQGNQGDTRVTPAVFYAAFALSVLWNGLLLIRTGVFGFAEEDFVGDLVGFLNTTSAASSFLIAGALAFFFADKGLADENSQTKIG